MMSRTHLQYLAAALLVCASCATRPPGDRAIGVRGITVRARWHSRRASQTAKKLAAPLERELAKSKRVVRTITRCDENGCEILLQHDSSVSSYDVAAGGR